MDRPEKLIEETRGVTLTPEKRLGVTRINFVKKTFSRKAGQNLFKTIATATASRDLAQGVAKNLLTRSGDKRTSVYRFEPTKE
jgi:hypothetical protein